MFKRSQSFAHGLSFREELGHKLGHKRLNSSKSHLHVKQGGAIQRSPVCQIFGLLGVTPTPGGCTLQQNVPVVKSNVILQNDSVLCGIYGSRRFGLHSELLSILDFMRTILLFDAHPCLDSLSRVCLRIARSVPLVNESCEVRFGTTHSGYIRVTEGSRYITCPGELSTVVSLQPN